MKNIIERFENQHNEKQMKTKNESGTKIKSKRTEGLGCDLNSFKTNLIRDLDKTSLQFEMLNNIPAHILFNADYSLVDRMKTKGDVAFCPVCQMLYIVNPCGCYHCQTECEYC